MLGMPGVCAEFERSIIHERVKATLAGARSRRTTLGRTRVIREVEDRVRRLASQGTRRLSLAGCMRSAPAWCSEFSTRRSALTEPLGEPIRPIARRPLKSLQHQPRQQVIERPRVWESNGHDRPNPAVAPYGCQTSTTETLAVAVAGPLWRPET